MASAALPAVQATRERQHPGVRRPAGQGFVQFTLTRALEDPGDLGQQVGPPGGEPAELGHRSGFLVAIQLTPPGAVPGLSGELSHENPVSLRAIIDHGFYSAG